MRKLDGTPPKIDTGWRTITVLSVSADRGDHLCLERLLPEPQWSVHRADTVPSALILVQHLRPIPLVVCERDLHPATWQDLLTETALLPEPPLVIVTSRLADDHLWAEALNIGAYDVLAKPFNVTELKRSLSLAWLSSQRREIGNTRPMVIKVGAA